jgi:UDP-N-acetylglucosamine:LPS N-acetylglucosamine transferase
MNISEIKTPFVAIACGGTGGHLFPGIAVAEELKKRGCKIGLLISPKEIDQQAVKAACRRIAKSQLPFFWFKFLEIIPSRPENF